MSNGPKVPGAPVAISRDEEFTGALDLTELIEEVDADEPPPSLQDRPSMLWGVGADLHSALLSTVAPTINADSWQSMAEEFAAESERAEDPDLQQVLLCEAGRVLLERLGRQEEGLLLMRNSGSPTAAALLAMREDSVHSLASLLGELETQATDETADVETRASAWIEFGLACEDHMSGRGRALQAYRAALELRPQHPVALSLAIDAAIVEGDTELAGELIRRRIQVSDHPVIQASLLLEASELTADAQARLRLLEEAHDADPTEETALRRLIRAVSTTHGDPRYLGQLYRTLASIAEDPLSKSTALHLAFLTLSEAGEPVQDLVVELLEAGGKAGDAADVLAPLSEVALYIERQIAADADGIPENIDLLERIVRSLDAPREQALVREQLARLRLTQLRRLREQSPDPEDSVTGLPELSEERLDLVRALEGDLRFCLVHLPEHRWVRRALADLLEYRGDVAGLVVHLQEWSRTHTAGPGRASILLRLGSVHEQLRRDLPRAAEVYELAAAEDPDNPSTLRALGRVYEQMRRWQPAVAALQRQARETDDAPERLAALRRVAQMAEQELRDVDLAIATLEEIADIDPNDLLALFQLAALCRAHGRVPILVKTLKLLVEHLVDDVARTATLVELGEVLELELKQRAAALSAYERALALSPGYTPALQALARLYRDNGDYESLLGLHDPEVDPITDPALLALKAGRICLDEMGELDRAIDYLRRSYEINPDLSPARELLLQLLTANGRIEAAYDLLRAQEPPVSAPARADYHYRLGLLAEALSRGGAVPSGGAETPHARHLDAALQHYRAALNAQVHHGLAWERSRRLLVANNDLPNLIRLFEHLRDHASGEGRAAVLVQLARLHASSPDGSAAARRCYEEAAQISPGDPLILREYEGLLRSVGDLESLPGLLLTTARHTRDPHFQATVLVEASGMLLESEKPEDAELAATAILDALRADPGNPYAVRHLERLLSQSDPPLVVTEAVGARAVRAQSDAERAIFYLESAELLERGGAVDQARRAYQAAIAAMPNLVPAELGLTRVASARARAPQTESRRSESQIISLHNLMAEARDAAVRSGAGGPVDESHRAVSLLAEVLERDPDHRDALALARGLTSQLADPTPALRILARAFPRVRGAELRYELALLLGEHAPRLEEAAAYLRAAVEAKPEGKQALRALVHCYRQLGRDDEAAEATEKLLELYEPGEQSAIELRTGIARFLGRNPATLGRALDHARVVLQARPDEPRAIALMADLLERNSQRVDAARLLDRLIQRERDRTKLHDLYLRQARLLATSGDQKDAALVAIERAAELNPGHRDTVRLLATLLEQSGQWDRLSTYLAPIRHAMLSNIGRGAVSIRDLRLLSQVARSCDRELAQIADLICFALDPSSSPPPEGHLQPLAPAAVRKILEDPELRVRLYGPGEYPALHELLQAVDMVLPRLAADFPLASETDAAPLPHGADPTSFQALLEQWIKSFGVEMPTLAASSAHNAAVLLPTRPSTLRLGSNLWMQGEAAAWRGLAALAISRYSFGGSLSRALSPIEMDLLIAACFELCGVFNAITADPDPRRLRDVTVMLAKSLPRRNRRAVERAVHALSGTDLVPGQSARATLTTDLRLAVLVTNDLSGVVSAACLLDGVAGGSLKQRISRSRAAQGLLAFVLDDEFTLLRRATHGR